MPKNICDMDLEELESVMNEYFGALEIAHANYDRALLELEQAKDEWASTKWLIEKRVEHIKAGFRAELEALRSEV